MRFENIDMPIYLNLRCYPSPLIPTEIILIRLMMVGITFQLKIFHWRVACKCIHWLGLGFVELTMAC